MSECIKVRLDLESLTGKSGQEVKYLFLSTSGVVILYEDCTGLVDHHLVLIHWF